MRWLLLWVLLAVAGVARAQTGEIPSIAYGLTGGTVTPSSTIRFANPADFVRAVTSTSAGDVAFADSIAAKIGTKEAAMQVTRTMPWASAARLFARALPYVGTAYALYTAAQLIRCQAKVGKVGYMECDQGQAATSATNWCVLGIVGTPSSGHSYCNASKATACSAMASATTTGFGGTSPPYVGQVDDPYSGYSYGRCVLYGTYGSNTHTLAAANAISQSGTVLVCSNGGSLGADGLCPNGTFVEVTEDQLQAKVAAYSDKTQAAQYTKDALATAQVDAAPLVASPTTGTLTGPATVTQPATTSSTTTSSGTTTTTTTPTNNITYTGNTYTYNTTNVTVQGDTTTTTTTTPDTQVCGLPGKPACKIDETGTPDASTTATAQGQMTTADTTLRNAPGNVAQHPTLGWSFGITLPAASCTAFQFYKPGGTWSVDLCTNWLVLFLRDMLAWAAAAGVAIYGWKRAQEVIGGA